MVVRCYVTRDKRYRVLVHEDQTAELCHANGQTITGRVVLYRVTDRLVALGVGLGDLIED